MSHLLNLRLMLKLMEPSLHDTESKQRTSKGNNFTSEEPNAHDSLLNPDHINKEINEILNLVEPRLGSDMNMSETEDNGNF